MAEQKKAGSKKAQSGQEENYEEELAGYLQERIKPGLNSGAIPLLARSIAKEIAHRPHPNGDSGDSGGPEAQQQNGQSAESEKQPDFEADMHELQSELGEDWILRFSVHGEDGWLTAETSDGTQRVEAQTAEVISEVVDRLKEGGGRSG